MIKAISKAIIRRAADGKYLVLTSSKWPERPERSQKPDIPGGMLEAGETHEQGCIREVYEETGLDISRTPLNLVYADSFVARDGLGVNRLLYLIEVGHDAGVTISWEHESFSWVTAQDLLSLDIREPYPKIFEYLTSIGVLY